MPFVIARQKRLAYLRWPKEDNIDYISSRPATKI